MRPWTLAFDQYSAANVLKQLVLKIKTFERKYTQQIFPSKFLVKMRENIIFDDGKNADVSFKYKCHISQILT